jgi:hypothetical protein
MGVLETDKRALIERVDGLQAEMAGMVVVPTEHQETSTHGLVPTQAIAVGTVNEQSGWFVWIALLVLAVAVAMALNTEWQTQAGALFAGVMKRLDAFLVEAHIY